MLGLVGREVGKIMSYFNNTESSHLKTNVMDMFCLLAASLNFPFQAFVANYKPGTKSFFELFLQKRMDLVSNNRIGSVWPKEEY